MEVELFCRCSCCFDERAGLNEPSVCCLCLSRCHICVDPGCGASTKTSARTGCASATEAVVGIRPPGVFSVAAAAFDVLGSGLVLCPA